MSYLSLPSSRFLRSKAAFILFLLLIGLCSFPIYNHSLSTDDYLLYQVLKGSETLSELGFSNTNPANSLFDRLSNAFNFFSGSQGSLKELQDYGALPWWTDQNSQMVMFRPVAALTHWIDFQLFDKNIYLIQFHSMAWFLFLAWSIFRFYKVFLKGQYGLVFLASLLYLLDYGQLYNFPWLAARNSYMVVAFACWCLYFHHKFAESGQTSALIGSLVCLLLALLTAEAGVATSAYLFAYAVTLDKRSWKKGLMAIVPAAFVVISWRLGYSALGFGSKGVGLYVDPLYSPIEFIESLFLNYGYLAFSQVSGLIIALKWITPENRIYVQLASLLFSFLCLFLVIKPFKKFPAVRFFLIGSLISIIPFCAHSSISVRGLFFCALGFFPIMAILIGMLWSRSSSKLIKPFICIIVLIFIVLPLGLKTSISFGSIVIEPDQKALAEANEVKDGGVITEKEGIVYLTYPSGLAIYLPYRWDWYGVDMPEYIFQLAPGLNSYTIVREETKRFVLTSESHFVLSPLTHIVADNEKKPFGDITYIHQAMHSMTSRPRANFKTGDIFAFSNYSITILEADSQGEVSKIQIDFSSTVDINNLEWRYWDWKENRFADTSLLPVGSSLFVASKKDTAFK